MEAWYGKRTLAMADLIFQRYSTVSPILCALIQCGLATCPLRGEVYVYLTLTLGRLMFLWLVKNGGGDHSWICQLTSLTNCGKFYYLFTYVFCPIFFLFFWNSNYRCYLILFHRYQILLSIFSYSFYFCILVWVISIDLSTSLLFPCCV